jgi:hypothetical protein
MVDRLTFRNDEGPRESYGSYLMRHMSVLVSLANFSIGCQGGSIGVSLRGALAYALVVSRSSGLMVETNIPTSSDH